MKSSLLNTETKLHSQKPTQHKKLQKDLHSVHEKGFKGVAFSIIYPPPPSPCLRGIPQRQFKILHLKKTDLPASFNLTCLNACSQPVTARFLPTKSYMHGQGSLTKLSPLVRPVPYLICPRRLYLRHNRYRQKQVT